MAVTLLAVGDVGAKRDTLVSIFAGTRHALGDGDILFGQLETVITDRGAMSPNARLAMRTRREFAQVLADTGFDVMSFAGNHCLDWGYQGFDDTLSACSDAGLALCGAGADVGRAHEPAIIERNGSRVAFLAYNSILPEGYAASRSRPGCAPLRAHTVYQQIEPDQPGTGARTLSFCDPDDLAALVRDVQRARQQADCVIVSMHWGIHMTEAVIADYQRQAARAAIDAGAAAILGHHAHILKGVEFYKGAPVFYSLGNFAIEQPHIWDPAIVQTESFRHLVSLNPDFDPQRIYMLPEATRHTGIARLTIEGDRVTAAAFVPARIDDESTPQALAPADAAFEAVHQYLERVSHAAGLEVAIAAADDALSLAPAPESDLTSV